MVYRTDKRMVGWDRCGRHVLIMCPRVTGRCSSRPWARVGVPLISHLTLTFIIKVSSCGVGSPVRVRHVQITRVTEIPPITSIMRGYLSASITRNSLTLIKQRGRRRKLYATSVYSERRTDMLPRAGILILVFRVNAL
jgi:hypothetical protein